MQLPIYLFPLGDCELKQAVAVPCLSLVAECFAQGLACPYLLTEQTRTRRELLRATLNSENQITLCRRHRVTRAPPRKANPADLVSSNLVQDATEWLQEVISLSLKPQSNGRTSQHTGISLTLWDWGGDRWQSEWTQQEVSSFSPLASPCQFPRKGLVLRLGAGHICRWQQAQGVGALPKGWLA